MHFDKIIIGSSPVCLLEAIYADSIGLKTCIIDNASELGGAWKKLNIPGGTIKGVEIGCHIIEKDRKVFQFFRDKLKLELKEIKPSPKIILKNKIIPYHWKNFFFIFMNLKRFFTDSDGGKLFLLNLKFFFKELSQFSLKYYTFSKGSVPLIEKLISEINRRNIILKLSTHISSLKINTSAGSVQLTTDKGELIITKKLSISNNSNFDEILIDENNRTNILQRRKGEFNHIHLVIKDSRMKPLTYWRIFSNEIHRVSDMSDQIKLNEGEQLICVGVFPSFIQNKTRNEIEKDTIERLKKMGLLSSQCEVKKTEISSYLSYYSNFFHLQQIESESNNLVEVVDTRDIALCIKKNLSKYNPVLYGSNS